MLCATCVRANFGEQQRLNEKGLKVGTDQGKNRDQNHHHRHHFWRTNDTASITIFISLHLIIIIIVIIVVIIITMSNRVCMRRGRRLGGVKAGKRGVAVRPEQHCTIQCNPVQFCAILCDPVQFCANLWNCAILCNATQSSKGREEVVWFSD